MTLGRVLCCDDLFVMRYGSRHVAVGALRIIIVIADGCYSYGCSAMDSDGQLSYWVCY